MEVNEWAAIEIEIASCAAARGCRSWRKTETEKERDRWRKRRRVGGRKNLAVAKKQIALHINADSGDILLYMQINNSNKRKKQAEERRGCDVLIYSPTALKLANKARRLLQQMTNSNNNNNSKKTYQNVWIMWPVTGSVGSTLLCPTVHSSLGSGSLLPLALLPRPPSPPCPPLFCFDSVYS